MNKGILRRLLFAGVLMHLAMNVVATMFMLYSAAYNYAGGDALWLLHRCALLCALDPEHLDELSIYVDRSVTNSEATEQRHVYIDNYCAQNGVTRWLQQHDQWMSVSFLPHYL